MQYSLKSPHAWTVGKMKKSEAENNTPDKMSTEINNEQLRPAKGLALGLILSGIFWAAAAYGIYAWLIK